MDLDRDRFLFLVVALSAPYGCNQSPVPTTPGGIATVYVPPPVATQAPPPTPRPLAEPPSVPGMGPSSEGKCQLMFTVF